MLLQTAYQQFSITKEVVVLVVFIVIIIVAVVAVEIGHAQDEFNHIVKLDDDKKRLREEKEREAADHDLFDKVEEYRNDFPDAR